MGSNQETFGNIFDASATAASGSETTHVWHAMGLRVRKVDITNDGSVPLLIRMPSGAAQQIRIGAGEAQLFDVISADFTSEGVGGTCVFRAHGEG